MKHTVMAPTVGLALLATTAIASSQDDEAVLATSGDSVEISFTTWAPSGDAVAFVDKRGKYYHVVVNGVAGPKLEHADWPVFSETGKHIAYRAREGDPGNYRWFIMHDGERQPSYSWVSEPAISHDGSMVAYWATENGGAPSGGLHASGDYFVVYGKKKGPEYSGQSISGTPPVISPDGKKVAYAAPEKLGQWHVVINKKPSRKSFSIVGRVGFSRDGKYYGYPAVVKDLKWAIVDPRGKAGPLFDGVSAPVFGKGRKYAFIARENGATFVVMGKKRYTGDYVTVGHLAVSPNGKRVAFAANRGGKDPLPGASLPLRGSFVEGGEWVVVVDGDVVGRGDQVSGVTFCPRSRHVAYAVEVGGESRVICGKKQSAHYSRVSDPVFSADGKHVGFGASRDGKLLWVRMSLDDA